MSFNTLIPLVHYVSWVKKETFLGLRVSLIYCKYTRAKKNFSLMVHTVFFVTETVFYICLIFFTRSSANSHFQACFENFTFSYPFTILFYIYFYDREFNDLAIKKILQFWKEKKSYKNCMKKLKASSLS